MSAYVPISEFGTQCVAKRGFRVFVVGGEIIGRIFLAASKSPFSPFSLEEAAGD